MREALRSLLVALQFLTRLPVRLSAMPTPEQFGRAVLCYPLVGVLIGVVLYAAARSLDGTPPLLQAALLLSLWVALSGALHLDGLADMADAWIGGLGDRERTLAIMKDPRSGPVAVVVLVLVLLLKFSALAALLGQGEQDRRPAGSEVVADGLAGDGRVAEDAELVVAQLEGDADVLAEGGQVLGGGPARVQASQEGADQ